jgi:hypothetical protein
VLSIEEYIARRKREDGINELDRESRMENLQTCVGYVFEYFNQYLDITKMEEQTALNNERLEKYRKQLHLYEPEIQEWLVNIYAEYDKQINRSISKFLKKLSFSYSIIQIMSSEVRRTSVMLILERNILS